MQRQIAHALRIARNIHAAQFVTADLSPPDSATINFAPPGQSFLEATANIVAEQDSVFNYLPAAGKQLSLGDSADSVYVSSYLADNPISPPFALSPGPAPGYAPNNSGYTLPVPGYASSIPGDRLNAESRSGLLKYLQAGEDSKQSILPLDWQLAGYIRNTYILVENKSGLSIIEQHIAHERVLYERFLDYKSDCRQNLLISLPLALTAEQKSVLGENLSELSNQGFTFEINDQEITCSQVPVELAHKDYAGIIQTMLQALVENSSVDPRLEIIKSLACQTAIKNGQPLASDQIIELLNLWYKAPRNETCPHGRPIELGFSYDKLFQLFHPD